MRKLFAGLVMISFMSCNNRSDSGTVTVTNSSDTVNVAAPVDTVAIGSDSVGTKTEITPSSDSSNKADQK